MKHALQKGVVALHARSAADPNPAPEARQNLAQSARTGSSVHSDSERRRRDTCPTDAELKRARRVGRPKSPYAKQLIAIRIDPRLLARLRRLARRRQKPYQTMIHELLERAAKA